MYKKLMNPEEKKAGVYTAQKKDKTIYYRSSFTFKNKHISLGSYPDSTLANQAYLDALMISSDETYTIYSYSSAYSIPFEKWVSIINFRDNGIYISNPIYIRKKYFSYFLSPSEELKFSIDDLFYYSSHKIIRRGGHLFVSDYGMQTSILSRYGIKSYGVAGKDYLLLNQDPFDFRYENVSILNPYQGVKAVVKKGKQLYQSKIHLHGDYIIGYYTTVIQAAIAYNKAIDIVKKNGCKKNFKQNYTEGISPSVYAEIYSKTKISKKIIHYLAE